MEIENRIVCFIDILGFREIIDEFEKTKDKKIIVKIQTAFNSAMDSINKFSDPEYVKFTKLDPEKVDLLVKDLYYKTFSDNVIITIRYDEINESFFRRLSLLLIFSNLFQYEILSAGVYTRGGVSFGTFFKDEHIIFSTALVKAYELENSYANFPRIILDSKLIEIFRGINSEEMEDYGFYNLVYIDWDNIAFLSPFSPFDAITLELENILLDPEFPLLEAYNALSEKAKTIFQLPHSFLLENYKTIFRDIKSKYNNISYTENVRRKYLWLIEFYNWKYKSGNSNLQFRRLKEFLY